MKSEIMLSQDGRSLIKRCRTVDECSREIRVYRLRLPFTPELLRVIDERSFEIANIKGDPLSPLQQIDFRIPGRMLATLHLAAPQEGEVLCHIDTNPRNYLIEKETGDYYMIDFAESRYSLPEHDLVNFLLFWGAMLEPENFGIVMQHFLEGYETRHLLDPARKELFQGWFNAFDERRRRYGKIACVDAEWQRRNREEILTGFFTKNYPA